MRGSIGASPDTTAWPTVVPRFAASRWETVFVVVAAVMLGTNVIEIFLARGSAGATYPPQVRLAFLMVYVVSGILVLQMRSALPTLLRTAPLLLFTLALPLASLVWSDDRGESLERAVAMLGTSLFGIYLGLRYTLGRLIFLLAVALGLASALSMAVILAMPSIGIAWTGPWAGTWIGVTFHKNGLGATSALGCIAIAYAISDSRGFTRFVLVAAFMLALVLLIGSRSTTALLGCVSAVALTLWTRLLQRLPQQAPVLSLLIGAGILIAIGGFVSMNVIEVALGAAGKGSDLSSRIPIWEIVWKFAQDRYWLGYGFEAFWNPGNPAMGQIERELYFLPFYSHNGLLETWLNGGLVLVAVVGLLIAATTFRSAMLAFRWRELAISAFPLAYCLYFVVMNFAESAVLARNSLTWALLVAVSVFTAKWTSAKTP